ncbi:calmodulin-like isoform X11 [Bolinopsis microptera]|uniref:calmodulin-like isoform X11 n=1 Tax=Bolinopsis microptera TaxID=2820187 RepID=UPI003078E4A7
MNCTYDDPTQFLSQQMYYGDLSASAAKRMNKFRYPQPAPTVRVELGRSFRENRKMSMLAKIDYLIDELQLDVHKDPDYERRVQDYTAAFQGMDNDGDGTITFEEFKQLWVKSGFLSNEGDIRILFNQVDVNGDGTISLKEFIELNERYAMPSTEEEIREAFKVFDKDNDGFITSDELKRILTKMGEPMCDEEAEEIIGYVDKNGDGKIDIDEFIVMMLKCIADEEELDQDENGLFGSV